jgi:hypothetical protein
MQKPRIAGLFVCLGKRQQHERTNEKRGPENP